MSKDTVEGMSERFDKMFPAPLRDDRDFAPYDARKHIKSFIQTELDLALTKERARASIIMKNVLHDASQKFESSINRAALSDAQKRITEDV